MVKWVAESASCNNIDIEGIIYTKILLILRSSEGASWDRIVFGKHVAQVTFS
jgi:hypothetical protein